MYILKLSRKAIKQLQKLNEKDQKRIAWAIDTLAKNPFSGKKLEVPLKGYWSVRVWPYRIIYTIDKKIVTVTVVAIGDRKDVYRKLH